MRAASICLSTLLALSCASGNYTKIEDEAVNPQFHGGAGKKILVLVATNDGAMREGVETQFAIEGVERNVDIVASHRLVGKFNELTRERLVDIVKQEGFDRVLIVRMVPNTTTTGKHTNYADHYSIVGTTTLMGDYWYSTYGTLFTPSAPPPSMGKFIKVNVETKLYNASDQNEIWNSVARVTSSERLGDGAKDYVKTTLSSMQRAGLV